MGLDVKTLSAFRKPSRKCSKTSAIMSPRRFVRLKFYFTLIDNNSHCLSIHNLQNTHCIIHICFISQLWIWKVSLFFNKDLQFAAHGLILCSTLTCRQQIQGTNCYILHDTLQLQNVTHLLVWWLNEFMWMLILVSF